MLKSTERKRPLLCNSTIQHTCVSVNHIFSMFLYFGDSFYCFMHSVVIWIRSHLSVYVSFTFLCTVFLQFIVPFDATSIFRFFHFIFFYFFFLVELPTSRTELTFQLNERRGEGNESDELHTQCLFEVASQFRRHRLEFITPAYKNDDVTQ